ncbi:hypothetical protein TRFO_36115 [Tritrichomonas foetus]|uniref:Serpin domain-containing protein n=1 Tax=Tritrichomonas foetus TaxID=1144522 RepID=A0A1J4JHC7_9EUKA|nr:hypothetical protein TRFO_36115 [Tritrichomonas foetus]|eukprot:OHS97663.1 hypothetical protein TRFO_36115 [Tritrichomonas foetus]
MTSLSTLNSLSLMFSLKSISNISAKKNCVFSPISLFISFIEILNLMNISSQDSLIKIFDPSMRKELLSNNYFLHTIWKYTENYFSMVDLYKKYHDRALFEIIRTFNGSYHNKSPMELRFAKRTFTDLIYAYASNIIPETNENAYIFLKLLKKAFLFPNKDESRQILHIYERFKDFYMNDIDVVPYFSFFSCYYFNKYKTQNYDKFAIETMKIHFFSLEFPKESAKIGNNHFSNYLDYSEKLNTSDFNGYSIVNINSFFFQGYWGISFTETTCGNFSLFSGNNLTCRMMNKNTSLKYFEDDEYIGISLSIKFSNDVFEVIMPKRNDELSFKKMLDESNQNRLIIHHTYLSKNINLYFPQFAIDVSFSNFAPNYFDDANIVHRQLLFINENGVKTGHDGLEPIKAVKQNSTSNATIMINDQNHERPKIQNLQIVRIDKPFIFMLKEPNGQIKLTGSVVNPIHE